MRVLETERLRLRRLAEEDADFILRLVNEPAWLRFIGDRGIRTTAAARGYILKGPVESYARHGFGLYLVELKEDATPAGICGLIKREALEDVDIGFAFLSEFRGKGYAVEAARAVMEEARRDFGLQRVVAVTMTENAASIKVLEKLGLKFERMIRLAENEPEIMLFAWPAPPVQLR